MDIKYIRSEENPVYIMTKNCSESDHVKHAKRITEGELWEIMETGMEDVNNNGVLDGVTDCDSTEYSRHELVNTVEHTNWSEWVLVTRSRYGKKRWTNY